MAPTEDGPGTEVPSHRACAHCRSQKVRCIVDDENPEVCQRCAKAGKPCVFTPLQKRKQRKRTDTRVAELEREMRAMRAMLKNKDQSKRNAGMNKDAPVVRPAGVWFEENSVSAPTEIEAPSGSDAMQMGDNIPGLPIAQVGQKQSGVPSLWPTRFVNKPSTDGKDVVDSGVISMATARQLFDTYRIDLFPHYPIVVIPESTTADELRRTKPVLFLSIIAAAAGKENSDLSELLDKEVLHTYATRSLVHSEKSLELIQALLISAVWYHPPSKFGQLKYYEYIHMAATMALDIGIGSRPVRHRMFGARGRHPQASGASLHPLEDAMNPDLSMTPRSRDRSPETGDMESRRTFLACYIVCAGVSMALRRPNMLRVNSYVRECLEYLERSPHAVASDRMLAAWIKLVMIGEEISTSFSYDDPGGIASISDLRTQLMLKDFEKKLSNWYASVPAVDMNESLTIVYYGIRLLLNEVTLNVEHSPEDFKAPFQMGPIHSWDDDDLPTQVLAQSIAECISSAHNLMNTFLTIDPESARGMPVFTYVRISYAAFVLAKLCLSAAHPGSRIGGVLDRSSLKVESFMDRAILHVRAIVGPVRCRVPAIFLALLFKLRQWCMHPEMIERASETNAAGLDPAKPADANSGIRTPASTMRHIEGPRVIESFSGDESSPNNSADSNNGPYESMTEFASETRAALDPELASQLTPESHDAVDTDVASTLLSSTADVGMPASLLNPNDQMELDQNFFQFFGGMNALPPEMGMADLNDWSTLSADLMNLPDNFNWEAAATVEGSTTL